MGYAIELTDDENTLLSDIELEQSNLDHERYKRQVTLVLQLLKSLRKRGAIPATRWQYWSEPEYQMGRLKTSYKGLFERNGRRGDEIYTHPHFLSYLRYFLFGAQLPEQVITEFEVVVGDPGWVSSSDMTKIVKGTRRIVRKYGLHEAYEEFHRLALDVGLTQGYAKEIFNAVKQVSYSR